MAVNPFWPDSSILDYYTEKPARFQEPERGERITFLLKVKREALGHFAVKPRDRLSGHHGVEHGLLRGLRHSAEGEFQRVFGKRLVVKHAVLAAVRYAVGGGKADHDVAGAVAVIAAHARKARAAALEDPPKLPVGHRPVWP